jgi:hypothetical protein
VRDQHGTVGLDHLYADVFALWNCKTAFAARADTLATLLPVGHLGCD